MAEPRVLLEGIALGESPRWHEDRIWFADWGTHEVIAVDVDGSSEVVLRGSSFPLCFDWLPDGRLLVVSARENRLLRREADGALVTHADLAPVVDRGWNEVAVDGRGNAYVDSIGEFEFSSGEVAFGVVALVGGDGSVREVAGDVAFPNGIAITPDDSTLILAESHGARLIAWDIEQDGGLSRRRVWAELPGAFPDGICLDAEGAVWYGDVPNKRCVRVAEGGEILDVVELDRGCFSCVLGGDDGRTLYMVAAEWAGMEEIFERPPTGRLLATEAPAPRAGRS